MRYRYPTSVVVPSRIPVGIGVETTVRLITDDVGTTIILVAGWHVARTAC